MLTCSTLLERQRDSPCGLCASAITVFIPVNKKNCTKRENKEQLIKAPWRQIRRRTFAAVLFRSVEWWNRGGTTGLQVLSFSSRQVTFNLPETLGSSGESAPKGLTTPIARQRRTLIRLSCCMRRTVTSRRSRGGHGMPRCTSVNRGFSHTPHSNCLCLYSRNEAEEVSHRILCRIMSLFSLISKEARLAGLLHSLIPSAFLTFWSDGSNVFI